MLDCAITFPIDAKIMNTKILQNKFNFFKNMHYAASILSKSAIRSVKLESNSLANDKSK